MSVKKALLLVWLGVAGCGDKSAPPSTQPVSDLDTATVKAAVKPEPAPPPDLPPWIEIRVGRVRVASSTSPWDGDRQERDWRRFCEGVTEAASSLRPMVSVGSGVCQILDSPQRQTDPTLPDLQLQLRGADTTYSSYVAPDQTSYTFDYPFAVPREAISEAGFAIAVIDVDESSTGGQEIGSIRLSKEDLRDAVTAKKLQALTSSGLDLLEVQVRPHDGAFRKQVVDLDTSKGGMFVSSFAVRAGDVVRIEAQGSWKIGRWPDNSSMGPAGRSDSAKGSRLKLFQDPANGAAVAFVGRDTSVLPVAVNPCVKFVAPYSGSVWVGVNDTKYGDNRGNAQFTVMKRGAKATQWASPGTLLACD